MPYKLFVMNVPDKFFVLIMEMDHKIRLMKMSESKQKINEYVNMWHIISQGKSYVSSIQDEFETDGILWSDLCLLKHIPRVREKFGLPVFRFVIADFKQLPDCRFCFV